MSDLLNLLGRYLNGTFRSADRLSDAEADRILAGAQDLIGQEKSPRVLGEVLRLDEDLVLPIDIVVAAYRRLIGLGARDARTMVCFARYLLLHGPNWDDEANALLAEFESAARAAGMWEGPHLGHHPVFFVDLPGPTRNQSVRSTSDLELPRRDQRDDVGR